MVDVVGGGRWNRKLLMDTSYDFLPRTQGGAKKRMRLRCCAAAEEISSYQPVFFYDPHYPEDNGFYLANYGEAVGPKWQHCPFCSKYIDPRDYRY